jgi:hypothetical protein
MVMITLAKLACRCWRKSPSFFAKSGSGAEAEGPFAGSSDPADGGGGSWTAPPAPFNPLLSILKVEICIENRSPKDFLNIF